jgi:hypothetical protein
MPDDFQLEEYKMLRTKAQDVIGRIEQLERNVVLASSAIFVFSLATFVPKTNYQSLIIYFLPLGVSLVGLVRLNRLEWYLREINRYTEERLERSLSKEKGGWLKYYYSELGSSERSRRSYRLVWFFVVLFNLAAGTLLAFPPGGQDSGSGFRLGENSMSWACR